MRRAMQTALDAADRSGVSVAADGRANGGGGVGPARRRRCRIPIFTRRPRRCAERSTCCCAAQNPAILVGSRVVERGAVSELVALAERLGAPVFSEPGTTHGRLSFPADHPLYAQGLPLWSPETARAAGRVRRRLGRRHGPVAAVRLSRTVASDAGARPDRASRRRPAQLGKNYPLAVACGAERNRGSTSSTHC